MEGSVSMFRPPSLSGTQKDGIGWAPTMLFPLLVKGFTRWAVVQVFLAGLLAVDSITHRPHFPLHGQPGPSMNSRSRVLRTPYANVIDLPIGYQPHSRNFAQNRSQEPSRRCLGEGSRKHRCVVSLQGILAAWNYAPISPWIALIGLTHPH